MFYGCENLEKLNLTKFYTNEVYNMSSLFSGCKSLNLLDIRNFNTQNINEKNDYKDIFRGIKDSNAFTFIYNKNTTKEISEEINLHWNIITFY